MNENKPIIAERIKNLRKENGLTQEQLAEILGLNAKSSIANYESGANSPSDDIKKKICELFNCSMDYLMGFKNYKNVDDYIDKHTDEALETVDNFEYILQTLPNFNPDKIANEMINFYKNNQNPMFLLHEYLKEIPIKNRDKAKQVILTLYNSLLFAPENSSYNIFRIPILGTVKAGYDWLAEENVIGYITDENTVKGYEKNINEYYALRVTGESMLPLLSEGDLVIVHDQDDVESGQTAVILINGEEATIKKVIKTNEGIELHAMNPFYPKIVFSFEDMKNKPVKIIGRVKEAKIKGAFE